MSGFNSMMCLLNSVVVKLNSSQVDLSQVDLSQLDVATFKEGSATPIMVSLVTIEAS